MDCYCICEYLFRVSPKKAFPFVSFCYDTCFIHFEIIVTYSYNSWKYNNTSKFKSATDTAGKCLPVKKYCCFLFFSEAINRAAKRWNTLLTDLVLAMAWRELWFFGEIERTLFICMKQREIYVCRHICLYLNMYICSMYAVLLYISLGNNNYLKYINARYWQTMNFVRNVML